MLVLRDISARSCGPHDVRWLIPNFKLAAVRVLGYRYRGCAVFLSVVDCN